MSGAAVTERPDGAGHAVRPTTPAQSRLLEELLAVGAARPPADLALAPRLRDRIERDIAPAVQHIPDGERLTLHKSALAALACDGRYLDHVAEVFSWSVPAFRGKLAHRAIELDWRSGRRLAPDRVVEHAWGELLDEPGSAAFLGTLPALDAAVLRTDAEHLVTEMRDVWPVIPSTWSPRTERRLGATFADGAVHIRGTTDLTIGRVTAGRRQVIVVDLKTGWRRAQQDRRDLRLYALLLTLKHGVAPFRVATYYVTEGAWDTEDVTEDTLETAVRQVVDGVHRAVALRFPGPGGSELRLEPGAYCRWCARAPECPAFRGSEAGDLVGTLPVSS